MARRRREWFDNGTFWRVLYPYMFSEKLLNDTPDQIKKILSLTRPIGKTILDLCCGPGRCSIAFAKKGFIVTGVDKTRFLLNKARAMAHNSKVTVEWVEADMRDFVRPDSFSLAISMFTSFGYFEDKTQDMDVLRNIFASLRPSGLLLIDIIGKEQISQTFQPTMSDLKSDGAILVQRQQIFDDWSRIRNEWLLIRKGKATIFKFHYTLYSGQELKDRLNEVGFTDVKLYGTLAGDDYGPNGQRLIAVARKPSLSKR